MLKFLAWLLVPLISLGGFILGCWLASSPQPAWQIPINDNEELAGLTLDHTLAVLAQSNATKVQTLRGIQLRDGQQSFQQQVSTPEKSLALHLTNGPQYDLETSLLLARFNIDATERYQIARYDWTQHQQTQRYLLDRPDLIFSEIWATHSTMMALGLSVDSKPEIATEDKCYLCFWNRETTKPIAEIPIKALPVKEGISHDGSFAHVIGVRNNLNQVQLIDVQKKMVTQTLSDQIYHVSWDRDSLSFLAFSWGTSSKSCQAQRFRRDERGSFVPEWSRELQEVVHLKEISPGSPFILASSDSAKPNWRANIDQWMGDRLDFVLDRLWPAGQKFLLLDKETLQVKHRFLNHREGMGSPIVLDHGLGYLLVGQGDMEYWEFYPFSRWYPLLGLGVGILLAVLLSWRLLRHRPNLKQPSPISVQ